MTFRHLKVARTFSFASVVLVFCFALVFAAGFASAYTYMSPSSVQGSTVLVGDGATKDGTDDAVSWINVTDNLDGTATVKVYWMFGTSVYSTGHGVNLKVFYDDTSGWRQVYSQIYTTATHTAGNWYTDSFSVTLANAGTEYLRGSIIDRVDDTDTMTGYYGCGSCGSAGGSSRNYDNADTTFTANSYFISPQGTSPVDKYNSSSQSVTFDLSCSSNPAPDTIQLWGNWSGTWTPVYSNSSYTSTTLLSVPISGISEGYWSWGVFCNTSSGSAWSSNRTLRVDVTAPSTTSNYTSNNTWVNGTQTISLSCSDSGSSCRRVWYCTSASSCAPSSVYSAPLNFASEGTTNLFYFSEDYAGNNETTKENTVKIDLTAPSTVNNASSLNNTWVNTSMYINLTCSDGGSGCDKTLYDYRSSSPCTATTVYPGHVALNEGGDHPWYFCDRSNDTAGNMETMHQYVFYIDTTPPALSIVAPAYNMTVNNYVLVNVSFTDYNRNTTILSFGGTNYAIDSNCDSSSSGYCYYNVTSLPQGNYSYYVWMNDSASNSNQTITGNVAVDLTPPVVTLVSPDNAYYTSSASNSFTASATDFVGLQNMTLYGGCHSWSAISTTSLPANNTEISFSDSGCSAGSYAWNVYACDLVGRCAFASSNYSITIYPVHAGGGYYGGGGSGGSGSSSTATPTPSSGASATSEPSVTPSEGAGGNTPSGTPAPSATGAPSVSRESAANSIGSAQALLNSAQSNGVDVSEANNLLALAQRSLNNGAYASAQSYAEQASAVLQAKISSAPVPSSSAGFDWVFAAGVAAVLVLAVGGAYWLSLRKR